MKFKITLIIMLTCLFTKAYADEMEIFIKNQINSPYVYVASREFACNHVIIPYYINNVKSPLTLLIKCNDYIESAKNSQLLFDYLLDSNNIGVPDIEDTELNDGAISVPDSSDVNINTEGFISKGIVGF